MGTAFSFLDGRNAEERQYIELSHDDTLADPEMGVTIGPVAYEFELGGTSTNGLKMHVYQSPLDAWFGGQG